MSSETYLEKKHYDRDEKHETASDLLILPPSSKAAPLSAKGFAASRSSVTSLDGSTGTATGYSRTIMSQFMGHGVQIIFRS